VRLGNRIISVQIDRERIFAAVANQRRKVAALVEGLDDAQMAAPSLCAGGRTSGLLVVGQRS
jgi:hypothetical protein